MHPQSPKAGGAERWGGHQAENQGSRGVPQGPRQFTKDLGNEGCTPPTTAPQKKGRTTICGGHPAGEELEGCTPRAKPAEGGATRPGKVWESHTHPGKFGGGGHP